MKLKVYLAYILTYLLPIPLIAQSNNQEKLDSIFRMQELLLEEIVITAPPARTPITGLSSGNIVLNAATLQDLPSLSGSVDLLKILEMTPSVRTSGDGNANLFVRGGDAGQSTVLYNNVACYTPGHILGFFPLFNPTHITSLQLMKEAVSPAYGNFLGSAIVVTTPSEVPDTIGGQVDVGLLASQLFLKSPIGKKWAVYLSGRVSYLELTLKPLLTKLLNDDADVGYNFWDVNLTVVGNLNRKNKLLIDVMTGYDKIKLDDDGIAMHGYLSWESFVASLRLQTEITKNLRMEQTLYSSLFSNRLQTTQGIMSIVLESDLITMGYKNELSYQLPKGEIQGGINIDFPFVDPHKLTLSNVTAIENPNVEDRQMAQLLAAFASYKLPITNRLRAELGLRYNIFNSTLRESKQDKTFFGLDVRTQVSYQLFKNTLARFSYSHNNQYINKLSPSTIGLPTDFWVLSNKRIRPQESNNYSLGLYQSILDEAYDFSLEAYYNQMKGSTEFDYNFTEFENVTYLDKIHFGKGKAYGVEFMVKKNNGWLTGWMSYAWGKSTRNFDGINEGATFPSRFDRRHDFTLFLAFKVSKKWTITWNQIFATGSVYTQPTSWYVINHMPVKEYTQKNNARLPNYIRTDISFMCKLTSRQQLSFAFYNALARVNPIYGFAVIKGENERGEPEINFEMKHKQLYRFIPSINWSYKF